MKQLLIAALLFLALPAISIFAVELTDDKIIFQNGETYTLEIKATPNTDENAVKLNIIFSGAIVKDYLIYNEDDWLTITSDCTNDKKFTQNAVCTTLVKTSEINEGESLGFIELTVTDANKLSIYKINGNEYSDGITSREDIGELIDIVPEVVTANIVNYSDQDPLLFYLLLGIGVVIVIILAAVIIYTFKPRNQTSTI